MKKLSVEEEVKRGLISAKYQFPCTIYDREGNVIRVVTHNIKVTEELIKLHPHLAAFVNTYEDDDMVPKPGTVKELMNQLGK